MVIGGIFLKWAYDLHIHTAASPCGDEQMTPHNIVNMSLLKGLEVIAITDHQTVVNCKAVIEVGKAKGLKVIAGMEIECMEEFHLITLFRDLQSAYEMEKWLWQYLPSIKNKPSIFGNQWILNNQDRCIGEIEQLLLVAAQISASHILEKARSLGALIYPANLGSIPKEYQFTYLEISKSASYRKYQKDYPLYTLIQSSDAHYLGDISEKEIYIEEDSLKNWIEI